MPTKHVTLQFDRIESQQDPDVGMDVKDLILGGAGKWSNLHLDCNDRMMSTEDINIRITAKCHDANIVKIIMIYNGTEEENTVDPSDVVIFKTTKGFGAGSANDTHTIGFVAEDDMGNRSPLVEKTVTYLNDSTDTATTHSRLDPPQLMPTDEFYLRSSVDFLATSSDVQTRPDQSVVSTSGSQDQTVSSITFEVYSDSLLTNKLGQKTVNKSDDDKLILNESFADLLGDAEYSGIFYVTAYYTDTNGNQSGSSLPRKYKYAAGSSTMGEAIYTSSGQFTWICPVGVYEVSVVCVGAGGSGGVQWSSGGGGGGGLGWVASVDVIPNMAYTVVVGARGSRTANNARDDAAKGGTSYFISTDVVAGYGGGQGGPNAVGSSGGYGGGWYGDGGGRGGNGSYDGTWHWAGAGAGGYRGRGADSRGSSNGESAPSGGGGGGGGYYSSTWGTPGGGGVGIYGQGNSGGSAGSNSNGGRGGSGGQHGHPGESQTNGNISKGDIYGGDFGGGGGGSGTSAGGGQGGRGAVRIIWGVGRSFPDNAS